MSVVVNAGGFKFPYGEAEGMEALMVEGAASLSLSSRLMTVPLLM